MAPVYSLCLYKGNSLDSESGNDSGSDSEGGDSSASGSRSSSPDSANKIQGSDRSKSRSASPANSQASVSSRSEAGSQGRRSRRDSASSSSPQRPAQRSPSGSSLKAEENAASPARQLSRSPSPGDQKSGSGSPARASDGGRSRSESPADEKSNASEKNSERSRSPSPEVNEDRKARSRSAGSNVSGQSSRGSRSGSEESDNDSHHSEFTAQKITDSKTNEDREGSHSPSEKAGITKSISKKSGSHSGSDSGDNSSKKNSRGSISPKAEIHSISSEKTLAHEKQGSRSPDEKNEAQENGRSRSASRDSESGSDGGPKDTPRKRKRAVLSDDSGSDVERKKIDAGAKEDDEDESEKDLVIDAEALFGDASDISSDEENRKRKAAKKLSDDEPELSREGESDVESTKGKSGDEQNEMEVEEKEEEDKENVPEEPQPETRIDVQIPKITTNLGKDIHFVKLPNFLSVETRPFDPTTYEDEIDEEETLDEEGRARLKLKVENTIRWKEIIKQNGEFDKQSNARFVKWSDGSMSLHLGSEIFDVYKQPLQGDHNHLFIRQGTGLQGQAVFRTKLTFRPHSTESFTHRKMTMSLADRSQKTAGIKILSLVGKDPEAHRGELIKKEEERLRASVRRESKQRRIREKGANRGLSAGYLEPERYGDADSDDEGISINAIKKQHKNKINNPRDDRSHIYSSDEEGSDIETRRARRLDKAKALKDSDSEGSGEGEGEGEEGEGEVEEGEGEGGGNKSGERSSSGED